MLFMKLGAIATQIGTSQTSGQASAWDVAAWSMDRGGVDDSYEITEGATEKL